MTARRRARPERQQWVVDGMTGEGLGAVMEIERSCFADPWPESAFEDEIATSPDAHCLVARSAPGESGNRPLGYVCLWTIGDRLLINNIAVHPQHRRKGLGHLLLRAALDRGRESRCRTALLEVRPSNETAIHLYGRHGFEVIGRREGYYSDTREDALLMRADLRSSREPHP